MLQLRLSLLQEPILTVGEIPIGDNHRLVSFPFLKVYALASPPTIDLSSALVWESFVTIVVTYLKAGLVLVTVKVLRSINEI